MKFRQCLSQHLGSRIFISCVFIIAYIAMGLVVFNRPRLRTNTENFIATNIVHESRKHQMATMDDVKRYEKYVATNLNRLRKETKEKEFLSFSKEFVYPIDTEMKSLVREHREKGHTKYAPINPFKYQFLDSPRIHCGNKGERNKTDMIYIIKSAPNHFQQRLMIRKTWASSRKWNGFSLRRVFLIGLSVMWNSQLRSEAKVYQDILRLSFVDDYYNNTLKTLGGIKWISEKCNNSKFVIMADDDYFFGTNNIWNDIRNLPFSAPFIMGKQGQDRKVARFGGKWSVSESAWPYDAYPPYVLAGAVVMSTSLVTDLNIASLYTKLFVFDDVYIGILCHKLGVEVQYSRVMIEDKNQKLLKMPLNLSRYLAVHGYGDPKDLSKLWRLYSKVRGKRM